MLKDSSVYIDGFRKYRWIKFENIGNKLSEYALFTTDVSPNLIDCKLFFYGP